jgi:protein TonB
MDNKNRSLYNITGFVVASIFYLCVLVFLGFYLQEKIRKNIKYTANKNTILDITLVEKKSKPKKSIPKKVEKHIRKTKKTTPKPAVKKRKSNSPKKISLQGLFKKVNIKNIKEPTVKKSEPIRRKIKTVQKAEENNMTKNDAKQIVKSLNFQNKKSIISSKDGVYDKFKGKITQILDENWQNTIDTVSGNSATVTVFVDKFGTFSYKIEKLSYNDDFNSKLRNFLEEMKDKEFPPFVDGEIFKIQVEFKDIRQ